ncbi:MAG: glutamate-5-semialdehyde dehydrogenase, partial [Planctomycetes bacterium]|nr:glutamate-5-semialdehyde dehydrogenase [Planctomycetota bacterium]
AAIVEILVEAAQENGLPAAAVQLVAIQDRDAVGHFLSLSELIDVAIPRGGEGLIRRVSEEATMPVIKHFAGNCHVYVDGFADLDMAESLTINSKCQRLGVCNTCESLLVHVDVAAEFLPRVGRSLQEHGIEIRGDARTVELIEGASEASEDDFRTEYLAPIISAKVVGSLEEAISHVNNYGSHHTDAIVTENLQAARQFTNEVDSSCVMVNASTRFSDGGEFGFGAEIGISTDKFHARGPCGLKELTIYKYVCYGNGQMKE